MQSSGSHPFRSDRQADMWIREAGNISRDIVYLFYQYPVSVVVIEFLLIGLVRWNVDLVFQSASGSLQICRAAYGGKCLL